MTRKTIIAGIVLTVVFQIAVLVGEYWGAVYPLWTGEEIRLKTIPVDPRSLFRGNYARLRYDISTLDGRALGAEKPLRNGEFVYVRLKPGADGLYGFDGAGLERPDRGPFIRGRVQLPPWRDDSGNLDIRYGIEAYFAPREKALALERDLQNGGVAVVMVSSSGKATLKEVIAKR